jgi:lactoylglutathione lyase
MIEGYSHPMHPLPTPDRLFEAHLTVGDLDRSVAFYRDVVGLPVSPRRLPGVARRRAPRVESLSATGVTPLSFFGAEAAEPSMIGWMPAAAVYFRDPDGHQLEYLAMLDEPPRPELGIVTWSAWTTADPQRGGRRSPSRPPPPMPGTCASTASRLPLPGGRARRLHDRLRLCRRQRDRRHRAPRSHLARPRGPRRTAAGRLTGAGRGTGADATPATAIAREVAATA